MTILPADFSLAGTLAARAWSAPPPAALAGPAGVLPAPGEVDIESEPHAVSVRPAATKPVTAMRDRRRMKGSFRGRTGRSGRPSAAALADPPILPSFVAPEQGCDRTVSDRTAGTAKRRPGRWRDAGQKGVCRPVGRPG